MLEIAAAGGDLEIVARLIKAGAEVNPQLSVGASSPLQAAAANGHLEVTKCLLDHQANISQDRHDDKTALQLAEENGHREIVELLCPSDWHLSSNTSTLTQANLITFNFLNQSSALGFDSPFSAMEIENNQVR